MLIPEEWRSTFELSDFQEKKNEVRMTLKEKSELIPVILKGENAVLNGYMDPIEIIDFPFRGKLMYITFLRRRWKIRGEEKGYHNTYRFHRPGMKTTDGFENFLKELNRKEFAELCRVWPDLGNLGQETL